MEIGVALSLGGYPEGDRFEPPKWEDLRGQARVAEQVGFDLVIGEDCLTQPFGDRTSEHWESMTVLAAIAEATSTIRIGHGVVNSPYRTPGLIAKCAETLDEISGGRFFLGIGAGNTPDADYQAFGIDADPRFSRFEEKIRIVADLLRTGTATFDGQYHRADDAQFGLRGPRASGPPIVIAAGGQKMMRLTAEIADGWNWWGGPHVTPADIEEPIARLEAACEEVGRDPQTLERTVDLYLPLVPGGVEYDPDRPLASDEETAEAILAFGELGVSEVRCYPHPFMPGVRRRAGRFEAIENMADVVGMVHDG